jgi:hypothetical protein
VGLHAFIDEAGQRARSEKSSAHFVMSAVVVPDEHLADAAAVLGQLRTDLGRRPGDILHWRNVKGHSQRLRIVQTLRDQQWLTISSVVVCKQHLTGTALDDDTAYLYTLRYLLERLSWLARDQRRVLGYTLSHIVRFKTAKLRAYEDLLRHSPDVRVAWDWLDPKGGRIDQPSRVELLQLADSAASATFAAFERDTFGNTESRYLVEMSSRLYRRPGGKLTSYGLKMHPWSENARVAYPWVATL